MNKRNSTSIQVVALLFVTCLFAIAAGPALIHNGTLQDALNANGQGITNAATVNATNVYANVVNATNSVTTAALTATASAALPAGTTVGGSTVTAAASVTGLRYSTGASSTDTAATANQVAAALTGATGTLNFANSTLTLPAIFSTGLTYAAGNVTVNTSQNIAKLSNLTGNGFVKTSGSDGTTSVDTNTYLTGNQSITLSGDASGSGATAITVAVNKFNGQLPSYYLTYGNLTGAPTFSTGLTLSGGNVTVNYGTTTGTALQGSAVDTDNTLAANSDTRVASQKAIKAYVDSLGYPPAGSVVNILGESLAAGVPIVSVNGSGQQNGYTGPGYPWPQWLSMQQGWTTIPIYDYGVSGAKSGDAATILAGGSVHGTEYLNGAVVGSIGGISTAPSAHLATGSGKTYWAVTYDGINDVNGSVSVGTFGTNQLATWATIRGYGANPVIIAVTSLGSTNLAQQFNIEGYNSWTRKQLGTATGADVIVDVNDTFQNNTDTNFYHTDGSHLNSVGYYYYCQDVLRALSGRPAVPKLSSYNPNFINTVQAAAGPQTMIVKGAGTYIFPPGIMDPDMTSGNNLIFDMGHDRSAKNAAEIIFNYTSSGSNSNFWSMGFYGGIVNLTGTADGNTANNWGRLAATQGVASATATVANTTTESSVVPTITGNRTIAANSLAVGAHYRLIARGVINNTGVPTLQIKAKLGSTVIADTTAITTVAVSGNNLWTFTDDFTCESTGGSGSVYAQGEFEYYSGSTTKNFAQASNSSATTIDTTASQFITVTATWGTASASNSITCTNLTLERIY